MHTVTADKQKRVRIPDAEPGQVFAYETSGRIVTLTPVQPIERAKDRPAKVRFEKRGRFTVAISDRPINEDAIKELLADFP